MMHFKHRRKEIINNITENWQKYQSSSRPNVNYQTNVNYFVTF